MKKRVFASFGLATGLALAAWLPVSGQAARRVTSAPPLVVTAYNGGPAIPYTTPRTPWGDPDLQGVWSSDDTGGIPLNRNAQQADRLYLNDEEWAARQKQVQGGIQNALNAIGTFRGDYA